jgi:hypothetical protein
MSGFDLRQAQQDGLGDLNDIAVDERLIASVAPHNDAFAAGLLTGREEARESEAISVATQGYRKLLKERPFGDKTTWMRGPKL